MIFKNLMHEYLDYKNCRFLNLKILKSQTRLRSNSAILAGFFRFEIKPIFFRMIFLALGF